MELLNILIPIIFVFKIIFILLGILLIHLKYEGPKYNNLKETVTKYKEIIEFIGLLLFSFLLLLLFNPLKNGIFISGEVQYILFLSGIVLFITLKWSEFFEVSKSLRETQKII
jgi:hypothetical protein